MLEDDPLFNAGRGAAFSAEGRNELDASIMDGRTLAAGAVTGLTHTRHPVQLARLVMERSPHVMLAGEPAEQFGVTHGLEQADASWFFTEARWRGLERFLKSQGLPLPTRPQGNHLPAQHVHDEGAKGTVGAVACDRAGNVAAATSTGGTTGKRRGRIGDSPIIGAGTYASNASCAVSATGSGEYFIRITAARAVCALVELQRMPLQRALQQVIDMQLAPLGGDGGLIAVGPDGSAAWHFNTPGMYRASVGEGTPLRVAMYGA
jgi:beta-aspartyl-peptidase (threonine type)